MEAGQELFRHMIKQNRQSKANSKDYLAIGVFTAVLLLLIVSAIYLIRTTKKDTFDNPFETVFKWIDDYWHEGKEFIEGKKGTWSASKKEKEIVKHFRTGHSLYRKKIYRKALHEFDKVIELDPNNYRAYFWRGRVYIKVKRYKEATVDFKMVIKLKPDYADAYDNLGWLYIQIHEYDESIEYLSKSLELKPNDGWAYYTRGRCYFQKGDLQKAIRDSKTSCGLGYKKGCQAYKEYSDEISRSDSDSRGVVKI
jgi:tetratricopeptide (TPR) repeat protein